MDDFSSFLTSASPEPLSRTQQKLYLQRSNISTPSAPPPSAISTRFKYEELSRTYMHIRRYHTPVTSSLRRITSKTSPSALNENKDPHLLVQQIWNSSLHRL
ncbi:hypothetical protein DAMA08_008070 [Martiniozyma asiatica (nom. inval.)]|nr:hypothetical protein DAMA08_008070 [Martiniozyma asiatica]